MTSIRDFDGPIYLCSKCGQPCYLEDSGDPYTHNMALHFDEQWDGVWCDSYPVAVNPVPIAWDEMSLKAVKGWYPNARG